MEDGSQLLCEVAKLSLEPGADYSLSLFRSFNEEPATKLLESRVETLLSLVLEEGSITDSKILYDMPKEFSFKFDKAVAKADVTLTEKGEQEKAIKTTERFDNNTLYISVEADLPRKADLNLTLN